MNEMLKDETKLKNTTMALNIRPDNNPMSVSEDESRMCVSQTIDTTVQHFL